MLNLLYAILPFALAVAGTLAVLWGAQWLLLKRNADLSAERKFPRQLAMLGLTIVGVVVIALALPVDISTRNQLIAFIGLVVSGIFAFSSTTLFANLMGGLILRIHRPFRSGDFIRVRDNFGRVAERGLFDTEIQTETRELITIPNLVMITNPVQVIRSSGTIISVSVSLGYDVHHTVIEPLLAQAARQAGLEDPFVHVTDLGNFSVTYKANGLLKDIKSVLTARSDLYKAILDTLHEAGIEIVSPNFMNQRPLKEGRQFIPQSAIKPEEAPDTSPTAEQIAFDKAEKAEKLEKERDRLQELIRKLEEESKESQGEDRESISRNIEQARQDLKALEAEKDAEKET